MVAIDTGLRSESSKPDLPSGDWLFKLHGEVLGPVPASELVERMYASEVDESTQVSSGDGEWRPLQTFEDFLPFLSRAKAKIRADRLRAEAERVARKRRLRAQINVIIASVALVLLGFAVTYFLIIQRAWNTDSDSLAWARKHVPLIGIPVAAAATLDQGAANREPESKINIDDILIDDAPALVAVGGRRPVFHRQRPRNPSSSNPEKGPEAGKGPEVPTEGSKVAYGDTLSNEEIMAEIRAKARIFNPCVNAELRRGTELPSTVVVSFSIRNDGRVGEVMMDDIKLENTGLHQCFREKMAALRFRAFSGEVRNIDLPINIPKS
jgi:hypothetical protein